MIDNNESNVRRLPLWKNTLEAMRRIGIEFGASFSRKWLEKHLGCGWGSKEFNGAIQDIRVELEAEGRYLSARGQKEAALVILPAQQNAVQVQRNQRLMLSLAQRSVVLLTNTPLDRFTADELRRHEATLERAARKLALLSRTTKTKPPELQKAPSLLTE